MTFKTDLQDDMDDVFLNTSEYGEAITYTPPGGSGTDISAIVDGPKVSEDQSEIDEDVHYVLTVVLSKTDVATPVLDATIAYDGRNYKVMDIPEQDEYSARLDCISIDKETLQKDGFRSVKH